jgi:tRNA pseudouridine38-40 synthase
MDEATLMRGLNAHLPADLRVCEALRADEGFQARFDVQKKTYFYQIMESRFEDPFRKRYFHRVVKLPKIEDIRSAAEPLVGEMDFAALRAAGSDAQTSRRRIHSIKVRRGRDWVRVFFTADGFLYKMVRNMISLIMAQAEGSISKERAEEILRSGDRKQAPPTFPGKGLFLWRVSY